MNIIHWYLPIKHRLLVKRHTNNPFRFITWGSIFAGGGATTTTSRTRCCRRFSCSPSFWLCRRHTFIHHLFEFKILRHYSLVLFDQRIHIIGVETYFNAFNNFFQNRNLDIWNLITHNFLVRLLFAFHINSQRRILRVFREWQYFLNTRHTTRNIWLRRNTRRVKCI